MRRTFLIMVILFFAGTLHLGANERETAPVRKSFFTNLNSEVFTTLPALVPYASDRRSRQAEAMRGMGIAGTVIFALSWPVWIAGVALIAYTYVLTAGAMGALVWALILGGSSGTTNSLLSPLITLYYTGIALIAIGVSMFFVGLTLMIVGFALWRTLSKRSRTSMYIEPSYTDSSLNLSYGFRIKL